MQGFVQRQYAFGPFFLDPGERLLTHDGDAVKIPAKAFQVLVALVERAGHLVAKEDLMSRVWPDAFVEEGNVAVAVSILRKTLGDHGPNFAFIQTVAKSGYRFVAEVRRPVAVGVPTVAFERSDGPVDPAPALRPTSPSTPAPGTGIPQADGTSDIAEDCQSGVPTVPEAEELNASAVVPAAVPPRRNWSRTGWFTASGAALVLLLLAGLGLPRILRRRQPNGKTVASTPIPPAQPFHSPQAVKYYEEGQYFWNKRTEQGLTRSVESFQQAIIADDHFALAYSGLADSYVLLASYGVEPEEEASPFARAAATEAIKLEPQSAPAHTAAGMVAFYYGWEWAQAESEFRRAIQLNPNYALAHTWYSVELAALGQSSQAYAQIQIADQLDPLSLSINTELGRIYYSDGQFGKAIEALRRAVYLDPYFARAHTKLGMAYAAKGDYRAALQEFSRVNALSGQDPYVEGMVGYAQARSGEIALARETLADLSAKSTHEFVPAYSMALVNVGLADNNAAFSWLSRSYEDRDTYLVYAKVDPLLNPIRDDPRFNDLLRRMGLLETGGSAGSGGSMSQLVSPAP